jgi:hypothetical protein
MKSSKRGVAQTHRTEWTHSVPQKKEEQVGTRPLGPEPTRVTTHFEGASLLRGWG